MTSAFSLTGCDSIFYFSKIFGYFFSITLDYFINGGSFLAGGALFAAPKAAGI